MSSGRAVWAELFFWMAHVGFGFTATGAGGVTVASKALSACVRFLTEGWVGLLHLFTVVLAGLVLRGRFERNIWKWLSGRRLRDRDLIIWMVFYGLLRLPTYVDDGDVEFRWTVR